MDKRKNKIVGANMDFDFINFDFGLFDGILVCHYSEERSEFYEKLKSEGKYKVFALTNDDAVVVKQHVAII